jgi:hypothetical protein
MKIDCARWYHFKGKCRLFWALHLDKEHSSFQIVTTIRTRRMSFHVSTWTPKEI